jgi:hypothetical protein
MAALEMQELARMIEATRKPPAVCPPPGDRNDSLYLQRRPAKIGDLERAANPVKAQ